MRKWRVILFVLAMVVAAPGFAQTDSSHTEAATELLGVLDIDRALQQGIDMAMTAQIKQNPTLTSYEDVMRKFLGKYMSLQYLRNDLTRIYAEEFTEPELRALTAFYRTDVGQKSIAKLPILMKRGAELGQSAVNEHLSELTEAIQQRDKELKPK